MKNSALNPSHNHPYSDNLTQSVKHILGNHLELSSTENICKVRARFFPTGYTIENDFLLERNDMLFTIFNLRSSRQEASCKMLMEEERSS